MIKKIEEEVQMAPEEVQLQPQEVEERLAEVVLLNRELWGYPEKENLSKAERILRALLLNYPENTLVMTSLGAVLCDSGKYDEALRYLERAERLGAVDRNLFENMGIVWMNKADGQSDKKKALSYFKKLSVLQANKLSIKAWFDPHGY
jgi:Tfp pilus assembly protein PilF